MCGITGFAGIYSKELLKQMNCAQTHRGPDDQGYYFDEAARVNIAMTRLSIVDIQDGHQPMSNYSEDLWIVFNGEIYNSGKLRDDLKKSGHTFRTHHSDTEALIYMYKEYGRSMVKYLNGMFAFVIYDKKQKKLFAARDQYGIKPFYYSITDNKFAFASELKSLLTLPWIEKKLDQQAVFDYFSFQAVPAPSTVFQSIQKLSSASWLEYDVETKTVKTDFYWSPQMSTLKITKDDLPEYKKQIKKIFLEAVQRWTLSDVEIACSLSGGIDSSAIVAAMAQVSPYKVKTYTVGYTDAPDMDEKELAKKLSEKWGTEHHEIIVKADDLLQYLDKMVYHLDEPYAGGLPSWFIYKEMSKDVKVAMTGTGGDELFGNYGKWRFYENNRSHFYRIRQFLKRGGKMLHLLKYPNGIHHYPYFTDGYKSSDIFSSEFIKNLNPSASYIQQLWKKTNPRDSVPAVDVKLQLPEEFLLMTDRFSMAYSIEARTPFLDMEFSELIYSIPASLRTSQPGLKYLFIDSIRDWLPQEIIDGPKKGFTLPLDRWLRQQLREKVDFFLNPKYLAEQGIFQQDVYKKIASPFYNNIHDEEWQLWEFLMFQMWYDKFFKK
ncbi:MAG TPA: asparagine synthase (glutamine-hydrolyzing) [Chitinophagaceae bacterium]|nr:asparagine synthase (glutamine-hydrolyzing) [Chitinophagaceae bacterium]